MVAFPSIPWLRRRDPAPWCRTALAQDPSLQGAVDAVAQQLSGCGPADLALVFVSTSYASDLPRLLPLLRQKLKATHWLGCVGGGVVGTDATGTPHELEQEPALSVTLLHLPGATLQPFAIDTTNLPDLDGPAEPWRELVGQEAELGRHLQEVADVGGEDRGTVRADVLELVLGVGAGCAAIVEHQHCGRCARRNADRKPRICPRRRTFGAAGRVRFCASSSGTTSSGSARTFAGAHHDVGLSAAV
jgi:hypothetical protein